MTVAQDPEHPESRCPECAAEPEACLQVEDEAGIAYVCGDCGHRF